MKKAPLRGAFLISYVARRGGRSFMQLVLGFEASWAFHFFVFVCRVASGFHPCCKEHAAFLCFGVVGKGFFALFSKAIFTCGVSFAVAFAAVGEETTVLFALIAPTHAGTTVEQADTAARNHHVELALLNVATDVRCHDDENLAFEFRVVHFTFVLALAVGYTKNGREFVPEENFDEVGKSSESSEIDISG